MTYWTLEAATDETVQLSCERYTATLEKGRDGSCIAVLDKRTTRATRSKCVYAGALEDRAALDRQSVARAALNSLAREYPLHTLPYVVHAVTGGHGAWCADGCTLMVLEAGSGAAAG